MNGSRNDIERFVAALLRGAARHEDLEERVGNANLAALIRRLYLERLYRVSLATTSSTVVDFEAVRRATGLRGFIGSAQLPVAVLGPVEVKGVCIRGSIHIPATPLSSGLLELLRRGAEASRAVSLEVRGVDLVLAAVGNELTAISRCLEDSIPGLRPSRGAIPLPSTLINPEGLSSALSAARSCCRRCGAFLYGATAKLRIDAHLKRDAHQVHSLELAELIARTALLATAIPLGAVAELRRLSMGLEESRRALLYAEVLVSCASKGLSPTVEELRSLAYRGGLRSGATPSCDEVLVAELAAVSASMAILGLSIARS